MDIPNIVSKENAVTGDMGQQYLATGKQLGLRRWEEEVCEFCESRAREYETVGYVLSGVLELELDGQTARLTEGDSWLVPAGATHRYRIVEPIVAIEATTPPARFGDRDDAVSKGQ